MARAWSVRLPIGSATSSRVSGKTTKRNSWGITPRHCGRHCSRGREEERGQRGLEIGQQADGPGADEHDGKRDDQGDRPERHRHVDVGSQLPFFQQLLRRAHSESSLIDVYDFT